MTAPRRPGVEWSAFARSALFISEAGRGGGGGGGGVSSTGSGSFLEAERVVRFAVSAAAALSDNNLIFERRGSSASSGAGFYWRAGGDRSSGRARAELEDL